MHVSWCSWLCRLRMLSHAAPVPQALQHFLAPGFQVWDAYGHMDLGGSGGPAIIPRDAVLRCMTAHQQAGGAAGGGTGTPGALTAVTTRLLDHAACLDYAASFSHWFSTGKVPEGPTSGSLDTVVLGEGLQVGAVKIRWRRMPDSDMHMPVAAALLT